MSKGPVRPTILIASDAGGVGKTLMASIVALSRLRAHLIAFDRGEGDDPSKFARLMSACGRTRISDLVSDLAPSAIHTSAVDVMAPFEALGDAILAGDAVVDTGSKAAASLVDWARSQDPGRLLAEEGGLPFLIVPATATRTSLSAARRAIDGLAGEGGFARGRAFLVLNGVHGGFEHFEEDPDYLWLSAEAEAGRLGFVVLPRCEGEVLPMVEAGALSFAEAGAIAPADLARRAGVSELRALWSLRGFAAFSLSALEAFAAAGFVPPPARERARAAALEDAWTQASARARIDLLSRVEAQVAGRAGLTADDLMRSVAAEDERMLVEMFPDLLKGVMTEVALARRRDEIPDFVAQRRGLEAALEAVRRRRRSSASAIEPRLGGLRRDVVVEAAARGIDVADHRVAAVSYVRDLEEAGLWALPRALAFLARYHVETVLIRVGLLRGRSPVPQLHQGFYRKRDRS